MSPQAEETKVDSQVQRVAALLGERLGGHLLSILYHPHALSKGGLVLVFQDDVESILDLITEAYECVPRDLSLYCVRRSELFELALPTFTFVHILNRRLHVAHCLRHEAHVLYGVDLRDEIPPPPDSTMLLNLHVESCAHSMRPFNILAMLARREYLELIKEIEWQVKCLMFTALIARGEWATTINSIPPKFEQAYQDEQLLALWNELTDLSKSLDSTDETSCRRSAYEAVWLFESFLSGLRRYI